MKTILCVLAVLVVGTNAACPGLGGVLDAVPTITTSLTSTVGGLVNKINSIGLTVELTAFLVSLVGIVGETGLAPEELACKFLYPTILFVIQFVAELRNQLAEAAIVVLDIIGTAVQTVKGVLPFGQLLDVVNALIKIITDIARNRCPVKLILAQLESELKKVVRQCN